ncbi:MAG: hypothetical protein KF773_24790 [Deltaproteobacteria bacterium]|nr:hypothetical protein [Deltaproteobacteria bacterium]
MRFPSASKYWTADEGRRVVDAWRQSGETATVFARRHGLRAKRLVYWSQRLSRTAPTVTFVPAQVIPAAEPGPMPVLIRVRGELELELTSATPEQVAAIVKALRSAP